MFIGVECNSQIRLNTLSSNNHEHLVRIWLTPSATASPDRAMSSHPMATSQQLSRES
ncbi:hypothetical protein M413DRAFT_246252 [Hebeloma cylindrosporum]|uniref:Uncharacterized protein n=1 Tax=Hebeloma cylindrosporum TaxID=76867 RepID=A0A0C2YBP0_HEBCY|nr:hypothetical protein M413DRAFT_246252 [Hebeloma cylindrosporum h7]